MVFKLNDLKNARSIFFMDLSQTYQSIMVIFMFLLIAWVLTSTFIICLHIWVYVFRLHLENIFYRNDYIQYSDRNWMDGEALNLIAFHLWLEWPSFDASSSWHSEVIHFEFSI